MQVAQKIAKAQMTVFNADGITCSNSTRAPADRWCSTCMCM
jgi:hypothetical protein